MRVKIDVDLIKSYLENNAVKGVVINGKSASSLIMDGERIWYPCYKGEHSWNDWEVIDPAGCEIEGTERRTCSCCGEEETRVIPAEIHNWNSEVVEPTCTEQGYTLCTCDNCGATKKENIVDALGHTWKDATCTEPKTCSRCGETEGLPLGHDYHDFVIEPTCIEQGYTDHVCSRCGDNYIDTYVDALGHISSDWITDTEATTTSEGSKHKECTVCGTVLETETIAKLDPLTYELNDDGYIVYATDTDISGDITVPSTYNGYPVKWIGESAFYGCTGITSVTLPDTIVYIDDSAFAGCTNLVSINIPDSTTHIYGSAFYNCESLDTITIPDSVLYIGSNAFQGCVSLNGVTCEHKYWRAYNGDNNYITSPSAEDLAYDYYDCDWYKFYIPVVTASLTGDKRISVFVSNKNSVAVACVVKYESYKDGGDLIGSGLLINGLSISANSTQTFSKELGLSFDYVVLSTYFTVFNKTGATATVEIEGTGYVEEETTTTA